MFNAWRQLNQDIVKCETAPQLFKVLQQTSGALTKTGGGGALNSINFSTALHRLARHSLNDYQVARPQILADPRFALLVAALAETMVQSSPKNRHDLDPTMAESILLGSRELSNIAWALAKLKIVPPQTAMPLLSGETGETLEMIQDTATQVRTLVLEAAQQSRSGGPPSSSASWIPQVSKLAGAIMDHTRYMVQQKINAPPSQREKAFQQQEISNLLWAWATSNRPGHDVFGSLAGVMMQQELDRQALPPPPPQQQYDTRGPKVHERRPQEWSNSVWAFATAQCYNKYDDLLEFVADLTEVEEFMHRFKPQEMSNTLWGVATLLSNQPDDVPLTDRVQQSALRIQRCVAREILGRAHEFKPQELANSLWSLATLGFGLEPTPDQSLNNYIVLKSDNLAEDRKLKQDFINAIVLAAEDKLRWAKAQELNNIAWALARLLEESTPDIDVILREIGFQLTDKRRKVTTQDIGTTLWAFATLSFVEPDVYRAVTSRLTQCDITRAKPQEFSNLVWAMATSEIEVLEDKDAFDTTLIRDDKRPKVSDPITMCFAMAAEELMHRPDQFKSQEIKDTLWSFSKVGIRHPNLFRSIAIHLVGEHEGDPCRGLSDFSPQGIGNMAWAFARQAQLCEEVGSRMRGSLQTGNSNGRLAVYTTSYFDIGQLLLHRFFAAISDNAIHNFKNLSMLKPQDLSNTAWSFGALGLRHDGFVENAIDQAQQKLEAYVHGDEALMNSFKGQEISNLLWTMATLNAPVGTLFDDITAFLRKLFRDEDGNNPPTAVEIAKHFKRQELANMAWSCAVFGYYPPDLISYLYTGMLGEGPDRSPEKIAEIFDDGGLQQQEVMSMIYVQLALEQNGLNGHLTLPPDFPGDWQLGNNAELSTSTTETSIELKLSTSRIQRTVSEAFDRIGFNHGEEHIITMADLQEEYGINLPPRQSEVLSIDIADVDAKIAIEVDGPAHYICHIDGTLDEGSDGYPKMNSWGKLEYQYTWDGERQRVNGPTALKHRLLTSLGWTVISIPFWEWYALEGDAVAEENYCKNLLAMAGE